MKNICAASIDATPNVTDNAVFKIESNIACRGNHRVSKAILHQHHACFQTVLYSNFIHATNKIAAQRLLLLFGADEGAVAPPRLFLAKFAIFSRS